MSLSWVCVKTKEKRDSRVRYVYCTVAQHHPQPEANFIQPMLLWPIEAIVSNIGCFYQTEAKSSDYC